VAGTQAPQTGGGPLERPPGRRPARRTGARQGAGRGERRRREADWRLRISPADRRRQRAPTPAGNGSSRCCARIRWRRSSRQNANPESGARSSAASRFAARRGGHPLDFAPLCLLSPAIDYIAAIEVSQPAAASQIREAQRAPLARLGKPLHWIGFNEQTLAWEPIHEDADGAYRHIRVGLQLVDRKGPLRDGDLSIFHVAMQDLATELMGVAELPLREPALRLAAQLDEFCAGVDIQIGINVISQGQVFPGTKLRALAESAGMVLDSAGHFSRCDDDGKVLFVLTNQETQRFSAESIRTLSTHGVTFLLDVPQVANGDRVLTQMVELGRRFAESLHGALVDDNRRPLSEGAIEPIRRQVVQYQTAMAHRQLPAGGTLAQRLFS
jgi:hypothetical protein